MEEPTTTQPSFTFDIAHQESYSRGQLLLRTFFGFIYIMIPHMFVLFFMYIAAGILRFIAWWAVLFTGKYPTGMHSFVVGTLRWGMRVVIYLSFMTDTYPPFSSK